MSIFSQRSSFYTNSKHYSIDLLTNDKSFDYVCSGSASGGSSSSLSVEKERLTVPKSEDGREGFLHCKITEIDGKVITNTLRIIQSSSPILFLFQRAADRSWKQAWVVLQGSKLYLCKDRNHQVSHYIFLCCVALLILVFTSE